MSHVLIHQCGIWPQEFCLFTANSILLPHYIERPSQPISNTTRENAVRRSQSDVVYIVRLTLIETKILCPNLAVKPVRQATLSWKP